MTKVHYGVIAVLIVVGFGLGGFIFYKKSPPPPPPAVSPDQAAAKVIESFMKQATPENIKKLTDNLKGGNKAADAPEDSEEKPKTDDDKAVDKEPEASQEKPETEEKPKTDDSP